MREHRGTGAGSADHGAAAEHRAPGKHVGSGVVQCQPDASPTAGLVGSYDGGGGGGSPLPAPLRTSMEDAFDFSFAGVRVHEGPQATAMGARAFTDGTDLHFAPGQYDPGSSSGKELIGHELAHVVQQSEGRVAATTQLKGVDANDDDSLEREADDWGARAARGEAVRRGGGGGDVSGAAVQRKIVQRAAVPTNFGRFIDTAYTLTANGVSMHLTFDPVDPVDATSIGMTQSVRTTGEGNAILTDPSQESRMVGSGAGAGYRLDRVTARNNPVYGADSLGAGQGLDQTATTNAPTGQAPTTTNATYELGHHYTDGTGPHHHAAWMLDVPERAASPNSGMEFETTALALGGTQQGTYYGSVRWGWRRDASGTLSKIDLTLVSEGVPSQDFLAPAATWNSATARGTVVARNAPTQVYRYSRGAFAADFEIDQGTTVTSNGSIGAGGVEYRSCTITSGTHNRRTGYIRVPDLRDQGDGSATADLPVPDVHTIAADGVELNKDVPGPWRYFDALPRGTRVVPDPSNTQRVTTSTFPIEEIEVIWVEIGQGPLTGHAGFVPRTALADERS